MAVSNVSAVAGAEIVQVYVNDEKSRLPRPEKELVAFEKVFLDAGETKHIRLYLDKYAVGYYDASISRWLAEEGRFNVLIGASSADIRQVAHLPVPASSQSASPLTRPVSLFTDTRPRSTWRNPSPGSFDYFFLFLFSHSSCIPA